MQITINNKKINYEIQGEGYPIVMLHGWLASLETMKPLTNFLSNYFKVYAVDIIGFGKSELPSEPLNCDGFGDFLKDFCKELKIQKPILIGHSNGGRTIINAVGRGLIEPKKIVLIDSAGIKPKRKPKYYVKVYSYKLAKKLVNLFPNNKKLQEWKEQKMNNAGSSDYKASPDVLKKTMVKILNEDQRHLLPNIKAPTLLIWGEADTATPMRDAKIMEKLIPDCGLVSYEGATHFSYLERLNECCVVLKEFLKNEIVK